MQDTPDGTIGSMLREGMVQQQQGRLDRAEACYGSVLERIPGDPDAQHLLGPIAHQKNRSEEAVRLIRRAVDAKPGIALFHSNLAVVLQALERGLVPARPIPSLPRSRSLQLITTVKIDAAAISSPSNRAGREIGMIGAALQAGPGKAPAARRQFISRTFGIARRDIR